MPMCGTPRAPEPLEEQRDRLQRERAAREVVRAADGDARRRRRRRGAAPPRSCTRPPSECPMRKTRRSPERQADLFHGGGQVLGDVLVDVACGARAEVPRAAVAAQVQVEDVVAGAREVLARLREGRCHAYRFWPKPWMSRTGAGVPPSFSARRFRTIASGTVPLVTTSSFTKVARSWRSIVCSRVRPWRIT